MNNYKDFLLSDLFKIENTRSFNKKMLRPVIKGEEVFDYVTRTSENRGILSETAFINSENINESGTFSLGLLQMDCFYRERKWYAGQFVRKIVPQFKMSKQSFIYFETIFRKLKPILLSVLVRDIDDKFNGIIISLPVNSKQEIDFEYIDKYIKDIEMQFDKRIKLYLEHN